MAAEAQSGMARSEWARLHGIDGRSLNAWRFNLDRAAKPAKALAPIRLVELLPAVVSTPMSARYVVRRGDLEVEVDDRFDDAVLARLLRVVVAC